MSKFMGTFRKFAVGVAGLGLAATAGASITIIEDTEFEDASWGRESIETGEGYSQQDHRGDEGNPPGCMITWCGVNGGAGSVTVLHKYNTPIAPLDAITSISCTFQYKQTTAIAAQAAFGLEQDGVVYKTSFTWMSTLPNFTPLSFSNLTPASFTRADGLPGTPDFSGERPATYVGVCMKFVTAPGSPSLENSTLIDNFTATVQTDSIVPQLAHEYNFENNGRDSASRGDGVVGPGASFASNLGGTGKAFMLGTSVVVGPDAGGQETVRIPRDSFLKVNANNMTVAFWYKAGTSQHMSRNFIVDAANDQGWRMSRFDTDRFAFERVDNRVATRYLTPHLVMDTEWHHVAWVFDRTVTHLYHWYIDGQRVSGGTANNTSLLNPDQDIIIGQSNEFPGLDMDGALDKLQVYNFALSAEQVAALANFNPCVRDLDHDGTIGLGDIANILQGGWGTSCP